VQEAEGRLGQQLVSEPRLVHQRVAALRRLQDALSGRPEGLLSARHAWWGLWGGLERRAAIWRVLAVARPGGGWGACMPHLASVRFVNVQKTHVRQPFALHKKV
jgi:hypothetical protein